jgi:hypothetical protein
LYFDWDESLLFDLGYCPAPIIRGHDTIHHLAGSIASGVAKLRHEVWIAMSEKYEGKPAGLPS